MLSYKDLSTEISSKSEEQKHYQTYSYRFVILGFFCLSCVFAILPACCFTTLQTHFVSYFKVPLANITFSVILSFGLSCIPGIFLSGFLVETFGFRASVILASVVIIVSYWLRTLVTRGLEYLMIAQVLSGLGSQVFMTNLETVTTRWFPANERIFATGFMTQMTGWAVAFAFYMPNLFIDFTTHDHSKFTQQVQKMTFISGLIATGVFLGTIAIFKENPPTPPSRAASVERKGIKSSLSIIFRDINFLMMLCGAAILQVTLNAFQALMQPMLLPFNITGETVGNLTTFGLIFAGIPNFFILKEISKSRGYKKMLMMSGIFGTGFLCALFWSFGVGRTILIEVFLVGFQLITLPIFPIALGLLTDMAFPVPEMVAGGMLSLTGQILANLIPMVFIGLIVKNTAEESMTVLAGLIVIMSFGLLLVGSSKARLKRWEHEKGIIVKAEMEREPEETDLIEHEKLGD